MVNRTHIIGNLGSDPELKYLQNGTAVCSFSVAVNERYTSNGEQREETTWYRVTCWRQLAEIAANNLTKGRQVYIEGKVKASAYLGKDGKPAASLELTAQNVTFLGAKPAGSGNGTSHGQNNDDFGGERIDDIPF